LEEFCIAFPPVQKIRGGYTRAIARCALADVLPVAVRHRVSKVPGDPWLNYVLLRFERERLKEVFLKNAKLMES
jgi:hypothetical protein